MLAVLRSKLSIVYAFLFHQRSTTSPSTDEEQSNKDESPGPSTSPPHPKNHNSELPFNLLLSEMEWEISIRDALFCHDKLNDLTFKQSHLTASVTRLSFAAVDSDGQSDSSSGPAPPPPLKPKPKLKPKPVSDV